MVLAQEESRTLGHGYTGTEHLLLGLTRVPDGLAAQVMDAFDVRTERVRDAVLMVVPPGEEPSRSQVPFTTRAKRTLEMALREALSYGDRNIDTEHLLLGMLRSRNDTSVRVLVQELGVDVDGLRERLIESLPDAPGPRASEVLGRRHVRIVTPTGLLGPLGVEVNGLAREIESTLGRPADTADLLLMLAVMSGTPAARALAKLGLELDDLQAAIESTRSETAAGSARTEATVGSPTETTAGAVREIRRRLGLPA